MIYLGLSVDSTTWKELIALCAKFGTGGFKVKGKVSVSKYRLHHTHAWASMHYLSAVQRK